MRMPRAWVIWRQVCAHLHLFVEACALCHELSVGCQQLCVFQLVGINLSLQASLSRGDVLKLALQLVILLL
jgi:hypothetical protein